MTADQRSPQGADVSLVHLYRAFVGVETMWRQRLDVTSNWAVPLVLALVTLSLSEPGVPHLVLLVLGWALIILAALVEARRYRALHHAAWRVGLFEHDFYAPLLDGAAERTEWRAALAADLRRPTLQLTPWAAFRSRFRATYAVLGYLLTLAWIAKLASHPSLATSIGEVLARLAIADTVPPWVVVAAALAMLAGATSLALTAAPAAVLERRAPAHETTRGRVPPPVGRPTGRSQEADALRRG